MRIPLDYYRILSVPVKATNSQLEQAYQDRLLQQPRREYSDQAKEARQELIQSAYEVLCDRSQRAEYDARFLLDMQPLVIDEISTDTEVDANLDGEESEMGEEEVANPLLGSPTIEILPTQIVGALLILHELGEYETVLKTGIDDFNQRESARQSLPDEPVSLDTTQEDLVLALTLAYMELGREQWHRQEYENAAKSIQLGIDLLRQQSLFPHLQSELESDLAKLRPYRVLELISQNPANSAARASGFKLLQSMLIQRQGFETRSKDSSGLNFDQFLGFVQQLRTYLTSAEQQELFDSESQAKSAIANYLAVYALLARGFALKQPELIVRAQSKLDYLGLKQDVSWEQSITALLLGHTEKAIYKLRNSPDPTQLAQVKQHSLGSSDLLPGICFYGEQWLLEDVLSQFMDLAETKLSLKEYFADQQVQTYLEQLSQPTVERATVKSVAMQPKPVLEEIQSANKDSGLMSLWRNLFEREKSAQATAEHSVTEVERELVSTAILGEHHLSTATIERNPQTGLTSGAKPQGRKAAGKNNRPQSQKRKQLSLPLQPKQTRAVPPSVMQKARNKAHYQARRRKRSPETIRKGWLFILGLIFGVGTIGYLGMKLFLTPNSKVAQQTQLAIALDQPVVEVPPKSVVAKPQPKPPSFTEQSQQVIQTWLRSKSAAFGQEHQIGKLNTILAEPLLTTWRDRAVVYQQESIYRQYEHQITVRSAKVNPNNQNQATVEAEVKEVAQHYQGDKLDPAQSYDDNLLVRYQLVRQGEKWLIQQAEVLETL